MRIVKLNDSSHFVQHSDRRCTERRPTMTTLTTLTQSPLAPLLDRLFQEANAVSPLSIPAVAALSRDERERMMRSKTDYIDLYGRLKDAALAVSRDTGLLLYMLARSAAARTIVEFGMSFGISTLHLAAALRDNGGGRVITSEFELSKVARARQNFEAGGLADLIEVREGDALQTLSRDLPAPVDLLLLDGAKALYPDVASLVQGHLRAGALVVADNADDSPDYLARVRAPNSGYLSTRVAEGVELSIWLG
jgi:predicted O-methyltransferase YrrM